MELNPFLCTRFFVFEKGMNMKKIAILRCLKSNDVCTGASCLSALHNRKGSFAEYDDELQLVAFMTCNGCGDVALKNEKGMQEKLKMIERLAPDALHVGVCTKCKDGTGIYRTCPQIETILCEVRKMNIKILVGRH